MSSSRTENAGRRRRDDAPDGGLGRRGHDRRLARRGRRHDRGRGDDLRDLHRQDRHRGAGAGQRGRRRDPRRGRRDGRGRDGAGPDRGRGRRVEAAASRARSGRPARLRRPRRPVAPAAPARRPRPPRAAPGAGRRYSPVVPRIAAEHGIDLDAVAGTGRDGRVRKQDVLALVDGNGADGAGASAEVTDPPLHIESPYRPDPPAPAARGAGGAAGGGRRRRPVADAPPDRRAHEALARHRGDLHDLDRGRHEPGRGGARAARA